MSHLTLETLARLVDETPTDAERTHLASCEACRRELAALAEQTRQLATLPDLVPSPDAWPRIRAELRDQGLLRPRLAVPNPAVRAAAAVFLFLAGGAMGYAVRGPVDGPAAAAPHGPVATGEDAAVAGSGPDGDPARAVEEAGEQFMAALDLYMATSGSPASDPAARLAALDNIVLTTAEALHEAPADPIINSYYLSARAQRDAMLRQLGVRFGDPVF